MFVNFNYLFDVSAVNSKANKEWFRRDFFAKLSASSGDVLLNGFWINFDP